MNDPRLRFRLSDLLFGATLVAILLGLFLPAVQMNNTRRSECASRLGELIKSAQQFELAHNRYPGYLEAFGNDAASRCKVGTWAVRLLPYLEQEPLYELWQDPNTTAAWNSGGGFSRANKRFYPAINLFICPDDKVEIASSVPEARNSFVCNAGFFPNVLPPGHASLSAQEIAVRSTGPANGVFSNQLPEMINSCTTGGVPMQVLGSRAATPTRPQDIQDGLTQTIAFSENLIANGWGYVGNARQWCTTIVQGEAFVGDDLHPSDSPRVHNGCVWLYRAEPPVTGVEDVRPTNRINGSKDTERKRNFDSARPSSAHKGLVYAAMLGGSVITLSENTDYRVYQALMTPQTAQSDVPDNRYLLREADYLQ